jgi:hypothetical protein
MLSSNGNELNCNSSALLTVKHDFNSISSTGLFPYFPLISVTLLKF